MTIVASSELYLQTAFASLSEGIFAHAANIGERDGAKPSQQGLRMFDRKR